MFVYRIQKYVGAYMTALRGADAIVFGGGIGENAAPIRARIVEGFAWLGVRLDDAANEATAGADARISVDGSAVEVWVIAVNEAVMLAREAYRFLTAG
jgi:acetate kinase